MKERKRVACFFTGGYTEINAMKIFMKKINDKVDYIQLCPNGPRRSKDTIKNRHIDTIAAKQSGLTGSELLEYVIDFFGKKRFQEEGYDAVLIEDDKDNRFLRVRPDGTASIDEEEWRYFMRAATAKLHSKYPDITVLFFFSAPEIEAWLLSDWDNGFGKVYKDSLSTQQNKFFSVRFRKHVNENILTLRYKDSIEEYGYFEKKYKKLSEEIQNALDENDFLNGDRSTSEPVTVRYSKRIHGEAMLAEIEPQKVMQNCNTLFKYGLLALKEL